jgi:hypothetical protein
LSSPPGPAAAGRAVTPTRHAVRMAARSCRIPGGTMGRSSRRHRCRWTGTSPTVRPRGPTSTGALSSPARTGTGSPVSGERGLPEPGLGEPRGRGDRSPLFDLTNGWKGRPPVGEAGFVGRTRPDRLGFPDGVGSAVAQAKALPVTGTSPSVGQNRGQVFEAGLVDEVRVNLVPVVSGAGVRLFGDYAGSSLPLENPRVVQGDRVMHLHDRVRRSGSARRTTSTRCPRRPCTGRGRSPGPRRPHRRRRRPRGTGSGRSRRRRR